MLADRRSSPAIALLLVLLIAGALRVASALTLGDVQTLHGDEGYYVRTARSIARGDGHPGALRPPGYPAFVALGLVAGGGSLRVARMAQIGVALIGVAALFALVRRRFGTAAATVSALVCALHPTLIFYSHLFWSETVVATSILLTLLCLDRFDVERRDGWLVAAGAALGFAVLTRDMLLFFVPVVVAWCAATARPTLRQALRRALLVAVPVLLVIAPWMARNQMLLGRPMLSTNGWYPIAVGNLTPRDGVLGMADENRAFVAAYDAIRGELERAAFARETALRAIAERQPGWIAEKLARNTYYLLSTASQLKRFVKGDWLAPGWRDVGRRIASVEAAYHVVQIALGLLALWLVPGGRVKQLVVALLLFHWAVYVVANATNRFRVPLVPLFALYTGPLLLGYGRRALAVRWRVAGAAASVAAFAAVVATPFVRRLLAAPLAVLLLAGVLVGCTRREPERPNVVLISIDTLRADHLGGYGYRRKTSPNLDALAARGVLFENAVAPSSWTLPSHASLLSGVSPYRHGAVSAASRIRDDVPLLAELLRAHGYHTVAFVNAPFVGSSYGFARGFERFDERYEQRRRDLAARHRDLIDAVDGLEPPFFLFVHYMDVHTPYRPPKEFNVFAKDKRSSEVLRDVGVGSVVELRNAAREGRFAMSDADRDRLRDLYDGEILALDAHLGTFLATLEGRHPDTLVIVTADHGEEFLEHGAFGHGDTLYEEVLRVPLIVAGPGVARGVRAATLATSVDVVPTVLESVGAAVPEGLDGRSLRPVLRAGGAGTAAARDLRTGVVALHTASSDGTRALRGVRGEGRKLLHDDLRKTVELYDLDSDPAERTNLARATTDPVLERALAALGTVTSGASVRQPDPSTVEALKALGYL